MDFQDFLSQAHPNKKEKFPSIMCGIGERYQDDDGEKYPSIEVGIGNRNPDNESGEIVGEAIEATDPKINFSKHGIPLGTSNEKFDEEQKSWQMHLAAPNPHKAGTDHHRELHDYTLDSHDVNSLLYGLRNGNDEKVQANKHRLAHARAMDKAIDATDGTNEDMSVYTGVKHPFWNHFKKGQKTAKLHMPSFVSTSTSFHVARDFSSPIDAIDHDRHPTQEQADHHGLKRDDVAPKTDAHFRVMHVLKLNMPTGTKAVSLRGLSEHPEEEEILLHRGHDIHVHANPVVHKGGGYHTVIWNADVVRHNPDILPRKLDESIVESVSNPKTIQCGIGDGESQLTEAISGIDSEHDQHKTHFPTANLSQESTDAIKNYSVSSLRTNSALYSAHDGIIDPTPDIADRIRKLDKSFESVKSKKDGVVYTGVRDSVFHKFDGNEPTVVHHPSYISTSTGPNIAASFAHPDSDHLDHKLSVDQVKTLSNRHGLDPSIFSKRIRHVLRLQVPAGSKAHSIVGISKNPYEHEVLIHRGHDITIDPTPHSIHKDVFAGDQDKGRLIVWNATLGKRKPTVLTEEKKMQTLEQFLESNRELLSNALLEEIHPDIMAAAGGSYGRIRLNNVAAKARSLLKQGVETGLVDGKPKKGSSRAVLFAKEPMDVKIDGVHTQVPHVLKIAFHGQLDSHTTDGEGLLGESQNSHEADASRDYSILKRVGHNEFHTNTESGFLPPLLDHHWMSVGKIEPVGSGDFKALTKTKEFPKGISHQEFYDAVNHHYGQSNGKKHYGTTSTERSEALFDHPLVQKAINFSLDTGTHPGDFFKRNLGVWHHPVTGDRHIVASDAGFSEHVARRYIQARKNQMQKARGY